MKFAGWKWGVVASLGLPLGCFNSYRLELSYPDSFVPHLRLRDPSTYHGDDAANRPGDRVSVATFSDRREDTDLLGVYLALRRGGCDRGGYERIWVETSDDVADWVTRAVAGDLQRVGYSVALEEGTPASGDTIVVTGDLLRADCRTMTPAGRVAVWTVEVIVRARRGNTLLMERSFVGTAPARARRPSEAGLVLALRNANTAFLKHLKDKS